MIDRTYATEKINKVWFNMKEILADALNGHETSRQEAFCKEQFEAFFKEIEKGK